MINSIESYAESGRKAGQAQRRGDSAHATFERDWFSRALRLEQGADRAAARMAWEGAYRDAATPPRMRLA